MMKNFDTSDHKLSNNDVLEVELYKAYKNDPFFKHYLHNHLSLFSEKVDESIQHMPYSNKGMVINK